MNRPDERKRLYNLWSVARRSSNPSEAATARAMLARLQAQLGLSDAEAAFIAENEEKAPISSDDSEQPPNAFELLLHVFEMSAIILNFAQVAVVAFWILHAHVVFDQYRHAARLMLRSRRPGCGKTTLLSLIKLLVPNGFKSDNATPASLYSQLQEEPRSTLLLDEMENSALWSRDRFMRALLDAGHRYDGSISRQIKGKNVSLSVFAPLAYALVSDRRVRVPEQLVSRSIPIDMRRHPEGRDEIEPDNPQIAEARKRVFEWALTYRRPPNCEIPFVGRDRDNFRPLLEIGEALGYSETARAAVLEIYQPSEDLLDPLVFGVHQVFEQHGKSIWTIELLSALHELPNAHWDEFRGIEGNKDPHRLTLGELYDLLDKLDPPIKSKSIQKVVGSERKSRKGFDRTQFEQVWTQRFAGTPAQSSKIIRLPRHKKRASDGA
jgi:hypothetical protein